MAVVAIQAAIQHIRSSWGVQYLAQGHFNMQIRGTEPATFCLQDAGFTLEPEPPLHF